MNTPTRRYRYEPIPPSRHQDHGHDLQDLESARRDPWIRRHKILRNRLNLIVFTILLVSALLALGLLVVRLLEPADACHGTPRGFWCRPSISHYWGQYSPYFSVPSEIAAEIPGNCKVTFAQILSRHGARDPTFFKSMAYAALLGRLKKTVTSFPDRYRFLATYSYDLGSDQLTTFGRQQMVSSGVKFYDRYQQLASHVTPFFRASGQQRVVESAEGFAKGFHASRSKDRGSGSDSYPYDILTIDEGSGSNNTLSHGLCDAFEDHKGEDQLEWLENFAALIKDRLNQGLPGANLSLSETIYLMDLCPFTTLASNEGRLSEFCDIFTETEWHGYDYFQSLGKYYGYANGNALGPTQGVGFVNELIARLTGKPVLDHTSVNHTLDRSDETFPIGGDNVLFADFSHDNDMMAVFAALGLYNSTLPLPKSSFQNTNDTNGFSASWTVSFAARAYIEKLQCSDSDEELVRVLVNDRIIPLETCGGDSLGRCTLDSFVDSMSFARQGGKWDQCFE